MDDPKEKTNTVYRFVPLYTVHHIVLKKIHGSLMTKVIGNFHVLVHKDNLFYNDSHDNIVCEGDRRYFHKGLENSNTVF